MRLKSSLTRRAHPCLVVVALATLSLGAQAEPRAPMCGGVDYNRMILDIIKGLPPGGGYSLDAQLPTVNVGEHRRRALGDAGL